MVLLKIFKLDDGLDIESPDYLGIRLSYYSLFIASLYLLFFVIYNVATETYLVALLDGIVLLMTVTALSDYYLHHNQYRFININMTIIYVLFLSFALVTKNQDYTLIWTILFPPYAIIISGARRGLIHTAIFYAIVFPIAFMGIGEWQNGIWNEKSFMRFALASVMMTFLIYYFKRHHNQVYVILHALLDKQIQQSIKMEELANTDPLTGLNNRRQLQQMFQLELSIARRHDNYFCFFIADIDNFKGYNDTYGHQKGDVALCQVSEILKKGMRRGSDLVFRLGGEEFGGLFAAVDESECIQVVDDIRLMVEEAAIEYKKNGREGILTISIGIYVVKADNVKDFDDLYQAADKALYQAKDQGRNRCISYTQITE